MIANSFFARFNAWLLKSEYTIVTSLQPNKFKDIIFKIITNISSTLLSEIGKGRNVNVKDLLLIRVEQKLYNFKG